MSKKNVRFDINPLLSGPSLQDRAKSGSPYREIAIGDIDVDPDQPRRVFEPEALAELAASIKEYGVLSPVLVRVADGGTYRLVAGERRLRASRLAGLETIPAVVDSSPDDSSVSLAKQLVENLQRADLTPMERAIAVGQLRDRYDWSVREIARRLGVSKGSVQRSLEVLELPDDLKLALINGAAESKVLLIAGVEDPEMRRKLLERIDSITRDLLEQEIKRGGAAEEGAEAYHGGTAKPRTKAPMSQEDMRIVEDLQRALGTRVSLVRKDEGEHGRLIIDFYSREELSEVYQRLSQS